MVNKRYPNIQIGQGSPITVDFDVENLSDTSLTDNTVELDVTSADNTDPGQVDDVTPSLSSGGTTTGSLSWQTGSNQPLGYYTATVRSQNNQYEVDFLTEVCFDEGIFVVGGDAGPNFEYYNGNSWTSLTDLPSGSNQVSAATVGGSLFAIDAAGGTGNMYEYDGTWQSRSSLPDSANDHTAVAYDNKLHVIGGESGSTKLDTVRVYDAGSDTWSTSAAGSLSTAVYDPAAAVYDGEIYVVGGRDGSGRTNVVQVYNGSSWSQTAAGTLPTSIAQASAAVYNDRLYVAGGNTSSGHSPVQVYDGNSWSERRSGKIQDHYAGANLVAYNGKLFYVNETPNIYQLRADGSWTNNLDIAATTGYLPLSRDQVPLESYKGDLVLAGGSDGSNDGHDDVQYFDATTSTWTTYTWNDDDSNLDVNLNLPTGFHLRFHKIVSFDPGSGEIAYMLSGKFDDAEGRDFVDSAGNLMYPLAFDGDKWYIAGVNEDGTIADTNHEMPNPCRAAAVTVFDGEIIVAGGYASGLIPDIQAYDGSSWTTKASMSEGLWKPAATSYNGYLYVIGGGGNTTNRKYDPDTDSWDNSVPDMPQNRLAAAAQTYNGSIYVLGGYQSSDNRTAQDEIFRYDGDQEGWTTLSETLPIPSKGHGSTIYNNEIYVAGGLDETDSAYYEVQSFDGSSASLLGQRTLSDGAGGVGIN